MNENLDVVTFGDPFEEPPGTPYWLSLKSPEERLPAVGMKIGQPTGELCECDGWNFERNVECSNMVAVRHDPYLTAVIALCRECNPSGEVYGPLDEPYPEDEEDAEHTFTDACCADCKQRIADEDAAEERWVEEQRCIDERCDCQAEPTFWDRARYWVRGYVVLVIRRFTRLDV